MPTRQTLSEKEEASALNTRPERLRQLAKRSAALALLIAQNPSAPSELLEELSRRAGHKRGAALAKNPNTPTHVLISLSFTYPKEFLENPALPLLLVEQPNFLQDLPSGARYALARAQTLPTSFMETFLHQEPHIRAALAENSATPERLLVRLLTDWEKTVRSAAKRNPNAPASLIDLLERAETIVNNPAKQEKAISCEELEQLVKEGPWARYLAASHPKTPAGALRTLSEDDSEDVRRGVAQNPGATQDSLERLQESFPREVAANRTTASPLLRKLAKNEDEQVQLLVAHHPNAPIDLVYALTKIDPRRAQLVAANPRAPTTLLEFYAKDKDPRVRAAAARNPTLPAPFIERLAKDSADEVREAVAQNTSTPRASLLLLANDKNPVVKGIAKKQLKAV